jgi:hypothetical protein
MPPKKMQGAASGSDMINFYDHKDLKKLLPPKQNPHFEQTKIGLPARIGVVAASGGGKSTWLLNFISKTNDTWGHIYICTKASEPIYEFLEKKVGSKNVTFCYKLSALPSLKDFPDPDKQSLVVFDDMCADKDQDLIAQFFIRGRKVTKFGLTMIYLSQSYFKIPKIVRLQLSYLIILKLSSDRDLNLILSENSLGLDKEELKQVYKDCTRKQFDFLKIDINNGDDNKRFSHNWVDFFEVVGEEEG